MEEDWRELAASHAGSYNLFQSYDWCRTWAQSYTGTDKPHELAIAVVRKKGRAGLIWPMMKSRIGPVTILRWLSDPYGQYGDVLINPDLCGPEDLSAAYGALTSLKGVAAMRFRHVRQDAAIYPFLREHAKRLPENTTAPFLDLSAFPDEDSYNKRYNKTQRRRRKRIRAKLEELGPITFEVASTPAETKQAVASALQQKKRWLAQRGLYSRPLSSPFLADMLLKLASEANEMQLIASTLRCGDRPIAHELGLRYKGRHCGFITSHDNDLTDLSPARLHMDQSQRQAIADGMNQFDLMVPGDKHSVIKRRVRDIDMRRFSRQYAAFKAGKTDQQSGTPLTSLPFMSASKAEEYRFFNIVTAEQLAAAADGSSAAGSIMGFTSDKQKAAAYIQMAAGNAPILQMQEKLEEKDSQIAAMQEQMNQMNAKLAELSSKGGKKQAVEAE